MPKQPRLKAFDMEFFGKAKTINGDLWWFEEHQDDGSIKRIPLQPITPQSERSQDTSH